MLPPIKSKSSLGLTRLMAYHAEVQHGVAEMVIRLEAISAHLDRVAADWSTGVDHGHAWPIKIVAAKYHAVESAWQIVDQAMELSGGFGMFKKSELERIFRDARAGRFHPANSALAHELIGKMSLSINPDKQPRWGWEAGGRSPGREISSRPGDSVVGFWLGRVLASRKGPSYRFSSSNVISPNGWK